MSHADFILVAIVVLQLFQILLIYATLQILFRKIKKLIEKISLYINWQMSDED